MAITFYDDIQTPKLEIKDPSSVFVIGFQAQGLIADAQYHLPPIPVANGQVLSSNIYGVMFWTDVPSRDYIASRSGNLISNFSGHLGDNTNFSNFTYDPAYSPPSFKTSSVLNSLAIDELIVVDPNEAYKMSVRTRWLNSSNGYYSMGLECLDVDERVIKAKHTIYKAGTTTYVTQDVAEGDNYIYVYSLDNWNETGTDIERSFIFWDEVSEGGHNYPSETYSRHVLQNAWDSPTAFDTNLIRIALRESWDISLHGPLPVVNTILSNGNDQGILATGQGDKYMMDTLTNVSGDDQLFNWTKHTGTIGGIDTTGTGDSSKFFPGTHSVKPKWEVGQATANTVVFNNLFFGRNYSSNGGNADNIGNTNLSVPDASNRFLTLGTGSSFSIANNTGDLVSFTNTYITYSKNIIITGTSGSGASLYLNESTITGNNYSVSLHAPDTGLAESTPYTLPTGYPTTSGYMLSSTDGGIMSWQAGGAGGEDSIYHTVDNATGVAGVGYYYDSLAGSKHLAMILQNRRSDIIQHGAISVLQAWSETVTSWVTLTLPEDQIHYDGVQALLDGRRDTSYNVPNGLLKFRFQVGVSTTWPLQTMVALQTGWTAAGWPQPQILVEEFADSQWDVLVTADFTNANGVTDWGLAAYASQGLHTGEGGSGLTRITVDCSNFVSLAGSTTVPLQNLYISSNYYGEENTGPAYHDYNNIINYDRDLVIPNSIRHEGNPKNHIALGSNSQTYYTNNVERALINDTGFRLGGDALPDGADSATVTGIDPDILLGGNTLANASHTLLVTQKAVKSYIHGLLYDDGVDPNSPDEGLSPGMIGDGNVSDAQWGFLNTISGNVQTQIDNTVYYTTANSNTLSAHTTAITAIQNTLKDTTGGGGKGVYADGNKATTASHLSLTDSVAKIQAGGNTSFKAEESSPGTLTMSVQSGQSGSEQSVTAITVAGSSTGSDALTTFSQAATFSMPVTMNSTLNLNGTVTGLATTQVTEGTNLYYTDARVQTYLSGGSATTIETSGDVTVGGNLIVSGTQTQLNTTTLEVEDINIVVGKLATTSALTDGAGLTFGAWSSGTIPTLTWDHANARFAMNRTLYNSYIKVGTLEFADEDNTIYMSGLDNLSIMAGGADIAEFNDTRMQISGDIIVTGTVDGIDIATDVAANTAKTGITSSQASAITANTAKTTITSGQASAITANTAKVSNVSTALTVTQQNMQLAIGSDGNSIVLPAATSLLYGVMSPSQAAAITLSTAFQSAVNLNTAKISFPGFGTTSTTALVGDTALLALGTSSTTALAGDTALLALGTSSTTALAGDTTTISSAQASAITANTAKTSYTDASAVAANTNKISYSTAASDAVALNTAKTGITSGQASAITANTAKVSNIVQTTITGNAGTATQLAQTVTIGGEDFDGDQSIDLPGVNIAGTQNTSGNAATATTLATARNIGGVSFNGSAAITLPGVNAAGTQDTSGNAATATKIASITNTDIVQLAGAQTLSGVKTFSSSIVSPGITSASNGNIVIDPHGTGSISLVADEIKFITGTGGFHGTVVKLFESSLLDGSYFYLAAPATMDANWGLTVPDEDGTQNQVMKTNGSGTLSWTSVLDGTNDTLSGTTNVKPIGGIDGKIAFYESTVTNYVLLQAHNDLASNYTLRLPTADGSANQTLKTDGSGNLGWSTPSSGGGAVDLPLMTLGGRVQHSTSYDNRMIICGGTYGPTYYIWSSPFGITTSGGGTVDTTTFTLSMTYQHYGAIRVPTAGKIKVDFIAKPLNSGGYSKPYVLQIWEFTPAIGTYTGATCTLRAKVDMTSSSSSMLAAEATMTTTSDIAAGKYVFVTMGMDAQTLTSTAYQYMNINLSILA